MKKTKVVFVRVEAELRQRMNAAGQKYNWSEIARRAFEQALQEGPGEVLTLEQRVERLEKRLGVE